MQQTSPQVTDWAIRHASGHGPRATREGDPRGFSRARPGPPVPALSARIAAVLRIPRRLSVNWLVVPAVFAVTLFTAAHGATKFTAVSPIDEPAHFDYAYKVYQGHLIPSDPFMSDYSLTVGACRGSVFSPPNRALCASGVKNPDTVDPTHVSYVLMYPPLYYWVVAAGMHILHPFGVHLYLAARFTSSFLYALSAALLIIALLRLDISRRVSLGAVVALVFVPGLMFWGSTITPDDFALGFGALGIILLTLDVTPRKRKAAAAVLGLVAGLTTVNLGPIGLLIAASPWLLPNGLRREPGRPLVAFPRRDRSLILGIMLTIAPVVIPVVWDKVRLNELGPVNEAGTQMGAVLHTTANLPGLLAESFSTFVKQLDPESFLVPTQNTASAITSVLNALLFGGAIVIAFGKRDRRSGVEEVLAISYLMALVLDVLYVAIPFYLSHEYATSVRYGVQLLPLALAPVALALDRGWVRWGTLCGGLGSALYFLHLLV